MYMSYSENYQRVLLFRCGDVNLEGTACKG